MAWIEVHQSLWDHRKTLALADALDLPELYAGAHLIALWTWAMDNAPDGTFAVTVTPRIIARGAKWTGEPEAFLHAALAAGFLEYNAEGAFAIHDWAQYGGKLNAQRQANAERQRRHRERKNAPADVTSQDAPGTSSQAVTVTSRVRNAPEKRTGEERTEPDGGSAPKPPADPPADVGDARPAQDPAPPSRPPNLPYQLLEAFCAALGQPVSVLPKAEKEKQLAVAKRLLEKKLTVDEMPVLTGWIASQGWLTSGIDLFVAERYLARWRLAGSPAEAQPPARAAPARPGGKPTPAEFAAFVQTKAAQKRQAQEQRDGLGASGQAGEPALRLRTGLHGE